MLPKLTGKLKGFLWKEKKVQVHLKAWKYIRWSNKHSSRRSSEINMYLNWKDGKGGIYCTLIYRKKYVTPSWFYRHSHSQLFRDTFRQYSHFHVNYVYSVYYCSVQKGLGLSLIPMFCLFCLQLFRIKPLPVIVSYEPCSLPFFIKFTSY